MKKTITILVPTDFSAASRAGMRFAIQWMRQQKAKLAFAHVLPILRLTSWSDKQYEAFATAERSLISRRLNKLAAEVCNQMNIRKEAYTTKVIDGTSADVCQEYCRRPSGKEGNPTVRWRQLLQPIHP